MKRPLFVHDTAAFAPGPAIQLEVEVPRVAYRMAEGLFDLAERCLAGALLLALSPLLLALGLVGKLVAPGPTLYRQRRVGRGGKLFFILKLRTMVDGAERSTGAVLSWKGDPRVTRWGAFLRRSHLDELPQLWNVLCGEMGFIGPRPERPEFVSRFLDSVPGYGARHAVRPGITGLAQICAPYDVAVEDKLRYDLMYLQHRHSPRMAFFIAAATLRKMVLLREVVA